MRTRLGGVHKVHKKLAAGGVATYYYAWRGGLGIAAKPDTRKFTAEHETTRSRADGPYEGSLAELTQLCTQKELPKLKPETQASYTACIDKIEAEYLDLPLELVGARSVRRMILEWRDTFSATPRKADLLISVFSRILSFGLDLEMIDKHPHERVRKLPTGTR